MDFYLNLFDPVIRHVQEHMVYYAVGTPTALIFIFFTRRYSVPLLLYLVELTIYLFCMHSIIHVVVRLTAWFKNNSSMAALRPDGTPLDAVSWTTPWMQFWDMEQYDPSWIPWMEGAFILIIIALMYRFRPMKTQYKRKSRYGEPPPKKKKKVEGNSDDDWGVPKKREYVPVMPPTKKTRGGK